MFKALLKLIAALFLIMVMLLGLAVAAITDARAAGTDNRPCATIGEMNAVHIGWTMAQVHARFDTAGEFFAPGIDSRHVWRWYNRCGGDYDYIIQYYWGGAHWRVIFKGRI